jgi:abortive infection bacteriophage resistance protein
MKYTKPALSLVDQADLLISRGMLGDREQIIRQLSAVNYYRLSGYWHTFRLPNSHDFSPNTTFDKVWMRYKKGEIDINETRKQISDSAGGIAPPSWY